MHALKTRIMRITLKLSIIKIIVLLIDVGAIMIVIKISKVFITVVFLLGGYSLRLESNISIPLNIIRHMLIQSRVI